MLAGAAMAFSSVFVLGNSLRSRSFKSRTVDQQPSVTASAVGATQYANV